MAVIKTSTKPAAKKIEASQFHQDIAKAAMHGIKTNETVAQKTEALVRAQYGEPTLAPSAGNFGKPGAAGGPTYKQYKADLKVLTLLAKQRELASPQWLVRPYGAALKKLYGALPVSMDPAAVAKRAQREAAEAQRKAAEAQVAAALSAAGPGAPQGKTQERTPSREEQIEAVVARLGVFETLAACIHILEADDATKAQAVHMRKMADKARNAAHPVAEDEPA